MKLHDYRVRLEADPHYVQAEAELRPLLDLADQVLAQRLDHGWSQAELARRVGTRQANISRLESGLANPSVKFLQKLADALGTCLAITLDPVEAAVAGINPSLDGSTSQEMSVPVSATG